MSLADDAVREFGRTMGMPKLGFNENKVVRLRFEKAGSLSIERTGQGLLLLLARSTDRARDGVLERALELCHPEKTDRLRPNAGLASDGALVFSVRLDERVLDLASMTSAFDLLRRLHDRAAG
jgi:type III secretion system chaperone SycN